jgi:hypothetical protein
MQVRIYQECAHGKHVASQINTVMICINNNDWTDVELPFGDVNKKRGRIISMAALA